MSEAVCFLSIYHRQAGFLHMNISCVLMMVLITLRDPAIGCVGEVRRALGITVGQRGAGCPQQLRARLADRVYKAVSNNHVTSMSSKPQVPYSQHLPVLQHFRWSGKKVGFLWKYPVQLVGEKRYVLTFPYGRNLRIRESFLAVICVTVGQRYTGKVKMFFLFSSMYLFLEFFAPKPCWNS